MCRAFVEEIVSKNLKLKKVNKSFVPEPISCFSRFPMFISRIHILVNLVDLYILYSGFAVSVDHRVKMNKKRNRQVLRFYQRAEKIVKHEGHGDTSNRWTWDLARRLGD